MAHASRPRQSRRTGRTRGRRDGSAAARNIVRSYAGIPSRPGYRARRVRAPRPPRPGSSARCARVAPGSADPRPHGRRTRTRRAAATAHAPTGPRVRRVPGGALAAPVGPPAGGGRGVGPAMPPLSSRPHGGARSRSIIITVRRFLRKRSRGCVYAETCVYARGCVNAPPACVYTHTHPLA